MLAGSSCYDVSTYFIKPEEFIVFARVESSRYLFWAVEPPIIVLASNASVS